MSDARPDIIYSTFGLGDSYDNTTGQEIAYGDIGGHVLNRGVSVSFIPSTTETLGQILVAVEASDLSFTVSVTDDYDFTGFGGTDGANFIPIETFNVTGDGAPEILTLTSVLNPVLTAGDKYWIEIQAGTSMFLETSDTGTWFNNDQGITGEISTYDSFCSLICAPYTRDATAPAVEVLSLPPANVPEPDTLVPMFVAALAIGSLRMRNKKLN